MSKAAAAAAATTAATRLAARHALKRVATTTPRPTTTRLLSPVATVAFTTIENLQRRSNAISNDISLGSSSSSSPSPSPSVASSLRTTTATTPGRRQVKSLVQIPQSAYNVSSGQADSLNPDDDVTSRFQEPSRKWESDLVVVLDMDECLIHSQFLSQQQHQSSFASDSYRQFEAARPYDESSLKQSCESFQISLPEGDQVHVNKRPDLDTFLKHVTRKYETHIFTAAMKVYASPVLDVLDPMGTMLQRRFYRESCSLDAELGVYVKDIGRVLRGDGMRTRFNEKRVVLVDNNPLSFLANPSNGILVSNFYDDPEDDTLPAVLKLLDELDTLDDVRPALDKIFGLKEALSDVITKSSSK